MQSQDCANNLKFGANFGPVNAKQEKLALISCICHNLTMFFLVSHVFTTFLMHIFLQYFQSKHFHCATFRKSGGKMSDPHIRFTLCCPTCEIWWPVHPQPAGDRERQQLQPTSSPQQKAAAFPWLDPSSLPPQELHWAREGVFLLTFH